MFPSDLQTALDKPPQQRYVTLIVEKKYTMSRVFCYSACCCLELSER